MTPRTALLDLMADHNLTARHVADLMGIHIQTVLNYRAERVDKNPSWLWVVQLADQLGDRRLRDAAHYPDPLPAEVVAAALEVTG